MEKKNIDGLIAGIESELCELAEKIWAKPELALEEVNSAELQKSYLEEKGFRIRRVNGLPTAFVAEFGEGSPAIGFLGEYDALPGLSQRITDHREAEVENGPGHGCGHNLIGAGCLGAAVALKTLLEKGMLQGTVRYFGCPAEEKFGGKGLMIKAGVFEGTDCCLSWHPESVNKIAEETFRAVYDVNFRFKGVTSHMAAGRRLGGNAVSALELTNIGVQYLRAHLNDSYIVDSCILKNAETTNVLPETTEVTYALRADTLHDCRKLAERISKIAQGAALMTDTSLEEETTDAYYSNLYNEVLGNLVFENMQLVQQPVYTTEELELAGKLADTLDPFAIERTRKYYGIPESDTIMHSGAVRRERVSYKPASDVGNVSYEMPVGMFFAATNPIGMPMHTWQSTVTSGCSLGYKGMLYAAKVLAYTGCDLLENPALVAEAKSEFERRLNDESFKNR